MFYFAIALGLLILCFQYDYRGKTEGKYFWYTVTLVVFILVAGLRYRLGTDSIRYENYFIKGPTLSTLSADDFTDTRYSPFYITLSAALRSVTDQFVYFQMIHSIVVNCVVFYFLNRYTKKIFFSVLVYAFYLYFPLTMEVLRESFAVCVFLLAWPFFRDGKWLKWYLMSFLAFFMHTSAIFMILLPLMVVPGFRQIFIFGKRTLVLIVGLYVFALIIQAKFFDYIQAISVFETVTERAEAYAETGLASAKLNIGGIIANVFRLIFYPVFALYFLCRDNEIRRDSRLVAMTIMSVFVGVMTLVIPIFLRFSNYLYFFNIIIIAHFLFSYIKYHQKRIRFEFFTWMFFFLPLFFFQTNSVYFSSVNKAGLKVYSIYYPYASRLDMTKDEKREKVFLYYHVH